FRLLTPPKLLAVHTEAGLEDTNTFNERSAHCKICPERLRIGGRHGSPLRYHVLPPQPPLPPNEAPAVQPHPRPLPPKKQRSPPRQSSLRETRRMPRRRTGASLVQARHHRR